MKNNRCLLMFVMLATFSLSGANSADAGDWKDISCSKSKIKLDYASMPDVECFFEIWDGDTATGVSHWYQSSGWGPQYFVNIMRGMIRGGRSSFNRFEIENLADETRKSFGLTKATAWGYPSSKDKVSYVSFSHPNPNGPLSCYAFYINVKIGVLASPSDFMRGYYCKDKKESFSVSELVRLIHNLKDGKRTVKTEVRRQNKTNTTTVDTTGEGTVEERLTKLKNLFDKGLINKNEYDAKRKEIMDSF